MTRFFPGVVTWRDGSYHDPKPRGWNLSLEQQRATDAWLRANNFAPLTPTTPSLPARIADAAAESLEKDLKHPRDRVPFGELARVLGLPPEIISDRLTTVKEECDGCISDAFISLFPNDVTSYDYEDRLPRAFNPEKIVSILYFRPVEREMVHDARSIPFIDLEFKNLAIPLDKEKNACFPLVIRFDAHDHLFENMDVFMREFPIILAWIHDSGFRVAYFEDASVGFEAADGHRDEDAITEDLSDRGKQWLVDHGIDMSGLDEDDYVGESLCKPCPFDDGCDLEKKRLDGSSYRDYWRCAAWRQFKRRWRMSLEGKLFTESCKAEFAALVDRLNRDRPKGTWYSPLYTLNGKEFPYGLSWAFRKPMDENWLQDPDDHMDEFLFPKSYASGAPNPTLRFLEVTQAEAVVEGLIPLAWKESYPYRLAYLKHLLGIT